LTTKRTYPAPIAFAQITSSPPPNLYTIPTILTTDRLKSRLSVLDKHLKVRLVPLPSLRRRLERILHTAVGIVARSRCITGTIGLATGLDPHESIDERISGRASRANTEASAVDVAPVTPLLAQAGDGVAARIDDGLRGHAGGLELRREEGDKLLLVLGLVPLRVRGLGEFAWGLIERVPASDVGGDTTDLLGAAGELVDVGEALGTGLWVEC
jgi:hypothetical protein